MHESERLRDEVMAARQHWPPRTPEQRYAQMHGIAADAIAALERAEARVAELEGALDQAETLIQRQADNANADQSRIGALEQERERLRVILDPFMTDAMTIVVSPLGTRQCVCVPPGIWRTTIESLYGVFYPPKEATDGA